MDEMEKEREVRELFRMEISRGDAAKAWQAKKTEDKVMDPDLCEEFAKILHKAMWQPNLGCATTAQLLSEIKTRIEMDGKLYYTTIDGEFLSNKLKVKTSDKV